MPRASRHRIGEPAPLEEVLAYRNPAVVARFRKLFDVSHAEASALFRAVLKLVWLGARQRARGRDGPTIFACQAMLDEMWHNFVLFSEDYERFCLQYFGHVVAHRPTTRRRALPKKEYDRLLDYNLELVYDELGPRTAERWYRQWPNRYSPRAMDRLRRSYVHLLRG